MIKARPLLGSLVRLVLLCPGLTLAVERATYNGSGGLTALIHDGATVPIHGEFIVDFGDGVSASLQPPDQRSISRERPKLHWRGGVTFATGAQAQFEALWTEDADSVTLTGSATAGGPPPAAGAPANPGRRGPLSVSSVDYVLDLPREVFVQGSINARHPLPATLVKEPVIFADTSDRLTFSDAAGNWTLALSLDQPRPITVTDRWDDRGRFYRVRIQLGSGQWPNGEKFPLELKLKLSGRASAPPARVTINPAEKLYPFHGFGGNFCFNNQPPVADYMLDTLRHGWARFELKGMQWHRERGNPGPQLRRDFELIQRVQRMGLPWVISLWRVPDRYYTDPHQKPYGTHNRKIAHERWPEFLDLIGSYLLYLKENYAAEPDMFSFNEPDLGVDIGFTAEEHRDMVKRVGAYLESLGLKTKLLLGDTANPRDSYKYVLPTLHDPDAMRYVAGLSFHSWGNGTPAHYRAWAAAAVWADLPLLIGEAGVDPHSWRNRMYDNYAYGLLEARQYQELLRDARPQSVLFWEYTEDYSVIRLGPDRSIEPTSRYFFIKHFANLSPLQSHVIASESDRPDVLVSAFARGQELAVHLLNTGPACDVTLVGLPAGQWRQVVTTETEDWNETTLAATPATASLPARSLTTFVRQSQ